MKTNSLLKRITGLNCIVIRSKLRKLVANETPKPSRMKFISLIKFPGSQQMFQRVNTSTHGTSHWPLHWSFWQGNLSERLDFAAWHRSARRLWEHHERLGMCFFVSGEGVRQSWPGIFTSRLAFEARLVDRAASSAVSHDCVNVHTPAYHRHSHVAQFRVICESVPRQILLLRLLVVCGEARVTWVLQFDKKSEAHHTPFTINHKRSTKSPSQTPKCM